MGKDDYEDKYVWLPVIACTFSTSSCLLSGAPLEDFPVRVESLKVSLVKTKTASSCVKMLILLLLSRW